MQTEGQSTDFFNFFGLTFIWVRMCVREMVGQSTFLPLKMIIF